MGVVMIRLVDAHRLGNSSNGGDGRQAEIDPASSEHFMSNLQTAITQSVTKRSRPTGASWHIHVGMALCALGLAWAGQAGAVIPASERLVLTTLYVAANGASWTTSTNWNGPAGTECTWYGVTCDAGENHVIYINLTNNNLRGSLAFLPNLTRLERIYLNHNQLDYLFPDLSTLTSLQYVQIFDNKFSGALPALPPSILEFDARANQFSGAIPSLAALVNLQRYLVGNNNLNGTIPSLTGLSSLTIFNVTNNQLTGSIPALAGLSYLDYFDAGLNQLTGAIPSLAGLSSLSSFRVNDNQLTGPIPSLTGLSNLVIFEVQNNQLTGTIPSLAGLDALFHIKVGNNQLTGPVPAVPAPTNVLVNGTSQLCPNHLDISPDAAWDLATGSTPWFAGCLPHAVPTQSSCGLAALAGLLGLAGLAAIRFKS